jgi:hypothetical protein
VRYAEADWRRSAAARSSSSGWWHTARARVARASSGLSVSVSARAVTAAMYSRRTVSRYALIHG